MTKMTANRFHTTRETASPSCPPLGILDWGIGGLGFFRMLRARCPDVAVAYFSDSGETPYGRLSRAQLVARLRLIVRFLGGRGVTHLVVACNAMSTVLPLSEETGRGPAVAITGVIEPTIQALGASPQKHWGIVGGRRTVLSGAYRERLKREGRIVRQRIAQPISRLIEDGETDSPVLSSALAGIVKPLRTVDALVLGCTHYSAALAQFTRLLPGVTMFDPAELTLAWIESHWPLPASKMQNVFMTTGSVPIMRTAARKAFGVELGDIQTIDVALRE